jgi:hypothetical protein
MELREAGSENPKPALLIIGGLETSHRTGVRMWVGLQPCTFSHTPASRLRKRGQTIRVCRLCLTPLAEGRVQAPALQSG